MALGVSVLQAAGTRRSLSLCFQQAAPACGAKEERDVSDVLVCMVRGSMQRDVGQDKKRLGTKAMLLLLGMQCKQLTRPGTLFPQLPLRFRDYCGAYVWWLDFFLLWDASTHCKDSGRSSGAYIFVLLLSFDP